MTHLIRDRKPSRCDALSPDGVIRWFLYFHQKTAAANGMRYTALDQNSLSRFCLKPMQAVKHAGDVLPVKKVLPVFLCNAGLEPEIKAGCAAVGRSAIQKMPALGFSKRRVKQPLCGFPVRVDLNGQAFRGIDQFKQNACRYAPCGNLLFPQKCLGISFQVPSKRDPRTCQKAEALRLAVPAHRIAGLNDRKKPLFGIMSIGGRARFVQCCNAFSAKIGAPGLCRQQTKRSSGFHLRSLPGKAFRFELIVRGNTAASQAENPRKNINKFSGESDSPVRRSLTGRCPAQQLRTASAVGSRLKEPGAAGPGPGTALKRLNRAPLSFWRAGAGVFRAFPPAGCRGRAPPPG